MPAYSASGQGPLRQLSDSLGSPADIGPILALRPLVEATILAKWISLDPFLHGDLWFAHAEDREITAIREQERHLGIRVRGEIPSDRILESIEQKTASRDESVERGRRAGKTYGSKPMPSLARLVDEVEEKDPGHRMAMRQAYDLAYRGISPWQHTEATSFKSTAIETEAGLRFVGDVSPYSVEHLRLTAGAMFAYVLEIVGIATGDGREVAARFIRNYLVLHHPLTDTAQQGEAAAIPTHLPDGLAQEAGNGRAFAAALARRGGAFGLSAGPPSGSGARSRN